MISMKNFNEFFAIKFLIQWRYHDIYDQILEDNYYTKYNSFYGLLFLTNVICILGDFIMK